LGQWEEPSHKGAEAQISGFIVTIKKAWFEKKIVVPDSLQERFRLSKNNVRIRGNHTRPFVMINSCRQIIEANSSAVIMLQNIKLCKWRKETGGLKYFKISGKYNSQYIVLIFEM
jgi:hypothetical protein